MTRRRIQGRIAGWCESLTVLPGPLTYGAFTLACEVPALADDGIHPAVTAPGVQDLAAMFQSREAFVTIREIQAAAEGNIAPPVWNFLEGGAGDEWTLDRNRAAYARWQFCPRSLTGIDPPDTTTTLLGLDLSMPVVVSPFGFDALMHPDGHRAVAQGAAHAGTVMTAPVISSFPLEAVRDAAPGAVPFFQPIAMGAPEEFVRLGRRAKRAGYRALVVTVDTPVAGWRERSMEDRWEPDPRVILGNFMDDPTRITAVMDFARRMWSWPELGDFCAEIDLPWMPKGILGVEDARAAINAGACGVFVSNHGGRQLEGAPATLDVLPDIVAEVGACGAVGIDGGVRRGSDVVKALALGADFVGLGRPITWGLGAAGADGVRRVLELIRNELATTMSLCGRGTVAAIDRTLVEPAPS
jgi:isopentenyl diphosphate isomerase/L-lactate dehydrogenase-like FMN-dependent dehydrogenase